MLNSRQLYFVPFFFSLQNCIGKALIWGVSFTFRLSEGNRALGQAALRSSLEAFKTCLDVILCDLIQVFVLWQGN